MTLTGHCAIAVVEPFLVTRLFCIFSGFWLAIVSSHSKVISPPLGLAWFDLLTACICSCMWQDYFTIPVGVWTGISFELEAGKKCNFKKFPCAFGQSLSQLDHLQNFTGEFRTHTHTHWQGANCSWEEITINTSTHTPMAQHQEQFQDIHWPESIFVRREACLHSWLGERPTKSPIITIHRLR